MNNVAEIGHKFNAHVDIRTKAPSIDLRSTSQANPAYTLPAFLRSELDDFPLTTNAFRVYLHLTRRAGRNGEAYPSYASIGKHCFRCDYPNAKPETLERRAREAIKELVEKGLIIKQVNKRANGSHASNNYSFAPQSAWGEGALPPPPNTSPLEEEQRQTAYRKPSGRGHCRGGGIAREGTPYEGTPIEDTPLEELTNYARGKSNPEQLDSLDSPPISENNRVATDTEPQDEIEAYLKEVLDRPATRAEADPPPTLPAHPLGAAERDRAVALLTDPDVGVWKEKACELASRFAFDQIERTVYTWLRFCKNEGKDPAENIRLLVYRIKNNSGGSVTKADRETELYRRFHPNEQRSRYSLPDLGDDVPRGPADELPAPDEAPQKFDENSTSPSEPMPTDNGAVPEATPPASSKPQEELSAKWALLSTYGLSNIPQIKGSRLIMVNGGVLPIYALQIANPSEVEWVNRQLKRQLEKEISRELGHKLHLIVESFPVADIRVGIASNGKQV
jgi:hypothetical protein